MHIRLCRFSIKALLFLCFLAPALLKGQMGISWFHPESLSASVLLEKNRDGVFSPHGTGILIYSYGSSSAIVITCEHILRNSTIYVNLPLSDNFLQKTERMDDSRIKEITKVFTKNRILWEKGEAFVRLKVHLIEGVNFHRHPRGLDVAGFKVPIPGEISVNNTSINVVNAKQIPKSFIQSRTNFQLGDDCYFVGFPYAIGTMVGYGESGDFSSSKPTQLLRKTHVAWISDDQDEFLLDSFSFPGNSGSPVFKIGKEPNKPAYYLIGMVVGHLSDGQGNIGLARCITSDDIHTVIQLLDP